MARIDVKLPDDFLMKLSSLVDKTDEIIPEVLEAGGEIAKDKVKSNLSEVVGKNTKTKSESTGELEKSVRLTPVRLTSKGDYIIRVGFSEPRSDGKSNTMVASILEYGKSGQPPKPFMKPAKIAVKDSVILAMQAKFEEKVNKI